MSGLPMGGNANCRRFLDELEGLPLDGPRGATAGEWLTVLSDEAQEHAAQCEDCEAAVRDLAATRRTLERMKALLPEAGPWFARRVMQAIEAQEAALEETVNGFWSSVRRLAPRMVAFATLLLMLGGTWAFEERRAANARRLELSPAEGIFEPVPIAPSNDDVIATNYEELHP
jgi:hypothetical protein